MFAVFSASIILPRYSLTIMLISEISEDLQTDDGHGKSKKKVTSKAQKCFEYEKCQRSVNRCATYVHVLRKKNWSGKPTRSQDQRSQVLPQIQAATLLSSIVTNERDTTT